MPEPTLDDHDAEFAKWWKAQGDTSDQPLYAMVKRAYFAGASYGSRCILDVYNETVKGFTNDKS